MCTAERSDGEEAKREYIKRAPGVVNTKGALVVSIYFARLAGLMYFSSQYLQRYTSFSTSVSWKIWSSSCSIEVIHLGFLQLITFLISDGKINTNFSCDDKWPNHDGTFEFVSNPELSRCPEQNFIVQIKGTQGKESIVIREEPEYLLVEYLDKESGTIKEIYNGPGALAWQYRSYVPSMNFYTIRINKLLELDTTISDEERITAVVPMKKYIKDIAGKKEITSEYGQVKKKAGKTLVKGYTNRNNQENYGCLNKPGNHYNQMAYLLHCNECGFEYEANGCDVAIRKCPRCMQ